MTTVINLGTEMVKLYGGPSITDGMWIRVPKLAQGIIVYDTLFEPPDEPAPYYPHWYAKYSY